MEFNDVCKTINVTTRLLSFINCRINQGRTSNWKKDFLMDCVFLNNILIQIPRFVYFPVTNSKGKIRFIGTLNILIISRAQMNSIYRCCIISNK